jgi:hypothetical protein
MRRHFLAIAVILTVTTGCDNVAWGGIDISVSTPESTGLTSSDGPGVEGTAEEEAPPEPLGPVLMAGTPDGAEMILTPVGVVGTDGLEALPQEPERMAELRSALQEGSRWVLFASGVRVGAATVTQAVDSDQVCDVGMLVTATAQLLPTATGGDRFLALPVAQYGEWALEDYVPLAHTYDQRVASLDLGRAALPRVGAPWPGTGMLPVRRDIQAFRPLGDQSPSFAVSFVVGDGLDTSPAGPSSYALFLVADQTARGFTERYLFYQGSDDSKAAPRFFGHLDWDGDGADELLLEVFGEGSRGYVALERGPDGDWLPSFASACPHTVGATER